MSELGQLELAYNEAVLNEVEAKKVLRSALIKLNKARVKEGLEKVGKPVKKRRAKYVSHAAKARALEHNLSDMVGRELDAKEALENNMTMDNLDKYKLACSNTSEAEEADLVYWEAFIKRNYKEDKVSD